MDCYTRPWFGLLFKYDSCICGHQIYKSPRMTHDRLEVIDVTEYFPHEHHHDQVHKARRTNYICTLLINRRLGLYRGLESTTVCLLWCIAGCSSIDHIHLISKFANCSSFQIHAPRKIPAILWYSTQHCYSMCSKPV